MFGGRSMGDWEEGMTSPEYGYKYFKIWVLLGRILLYDLQFDTMYVYILHKYLLFLEKINRVLYDN